MIFHTKGGSIIHLWRPQRESPRNFHTRSIYYSSMEAPTGVTKALETSCNSTDYNQRWLLTVYSDHPPVSSLL